MIVNLKGRGVKYAKKKNRAVVCIKGEKLGVAKCKMVNSIRNIH
jgi:hypothetical protein